MRIVRMVAMATFMAVFGLLFATMSGAGQDSTPGRVTALETQVADLESRVARLEGSDAPKPTATSAARTGGGDFSFSGGAYDQALPVVSIPGGNYKVTFSCTRTEDTFIDWMSVMLTSADDGWDLELELIDGDCPATETYYWDLDGGEYLIEIQATQPWTLDLERV